MHPPAESIPIRREPDVLRMLRYRRRNLDRHGQIQ